MTGSFYLPNSLLHKAFVNFYVEQRPLFQVQFLRMPSLLNLPNSILHVYLCSSGTTQESRTTQSVQNPYSTLQLLTHSALFSPMLPTCTSTVAYLSSSANYYIKSKNNSSCYILYVLHFFEFLNYWIRFY